MAYSSWSLILFSFILTFPLLIEFLPFTLFHLLLLTLNSSCMLILFFVTLFYINRLLFPPFHHDLQFCNFFFHHVLFSLSRFPLNSMASFNLNSSSWSFSYINSILFFMKITSSSFTYNSDDHESGVVVVSCVSLWSWAL